MKIGINWSGQRELEVLKGVLQTSDVDFIEILIDNFIVTDYDTIKRVLDGRDCSFHIMNSQFLHAPDKKMIEMSVALKKLKKHLKPKYLSDHIGIFEYKNHNLPQMLEIEYSDSIYHDVKQKLNKWQSILEEQLLVENYASIIPQKNEQNAFYAHLLKDTNASLLFDISNAVIAEKNTGENKSKWLKIIKNYEIKAFHIAGFEINKQGGFFVDTHSTEIALESLEFLEEILQVNKKIYVSVERDENFIIDEWCSDIQKVRSYI